MKQNKFKVWDKENNIFVEYGNGDFREWCLRSDGKVGWISKDGYLQDGDRELMPVIFTGLKDKNGVEIYAGDILLITEYDGKTEKFAIENKYDWDWDGEGRWGICIGTDRPEHEAEVIGNIYQNKDLLN